MAHVNNTTLTATGDVIAMIDSDNDEANCKFAVAHNGGGGPEIFRVYESGAVQVFGEIYNNGGAVEIDNTSGAGDIVRFEYGGTVQAKVANTGLGIFDKDGVRLLVINYDPNGTKAGTLGDLLIYYNQADGRVLPDALHWLDHLAVQPVLLASRRVHPRGGSPAPRKG